ncbi:hypothetical protein F4814DRAFT_445746 [Daldinia grandis]|nr:hypothetical protein F4814DRAFT_445746 [Daldinia grandis]
MGSEMGSEMGFLFTSSSLECLLISLWILLLELVNVKEAAVAFISIVAFNFGFLLACFYGVSTEDAKVAAEGRAIWAEKAPLRRQQEVKWIDAL